MAKGGKAAVVPRLRFPEFQDEHGWTSAELGRLAKFVTERVGTTACIPYTVTSGEGLISQQEKLGRTIAGNSIKNYIVLQRDDFAYNKSATKAFPQGFIARYVGTDRAAVPNSIFTCFRVDNKAVEPAYLDYLFSSNLHGKWLRTRITVGARAHGSLNVSDDDLMALPVPLPDGPASLGEQQKIADCLTSLDEVIAVQGRKIETLKTYKRCLMQQLFPREGETLPRLRFPEFRDLGQWQPYELGPFLVEHIERVPSDTALPIYSSTRTGLKLQKDYYDNRELANDGEYGIVPEGLFVYRHMSDDGAFKFNINSTGARIAVSKEYPVFAVENMYPQFLFYLLNEGHEFKKYALAQKKGGTRTRLYLGVLRLCRVLLPSYEEQQRITDCLFSLDSQISAESAKLDALKTRKKGLMQQLFPSPEEA